MLLDDYLSEAVEVLRPAVVAKAFPLLPYQVWRGIREVAERRVGVEKPVIERFDPTDLGLLEHELRYQNTIRVAGSSPGQIPARSLEPGHDQATERG